MEVVAATDSFKDSVTAVPACDLVDQAVFSAVPDVEVVANPMADGEAGAAVARIAKATCTRAGVLAGQVPRILQKHRDAGIETALACANGGTQLECTVADRENLLDRVTRRFGSNCLYACCGRGQPRRAGLCGSLWVMCCASGLQNAHP